MPDITMCLDHQCNKKNTCYRYLAKPSTYQSYFVRSPRENKRCEQYRENLSQKILQALESKK
jgi:hypothetical protein